MKKTIKVLGVIAVGLVAVGLFGLIFMWLWNSIIPVIFGLAIINFWQSLGIIAMAKILFGRGFGGRKFRKRGCNSRRHSDFFKEREGGRRGLREMWNNMSEDEKAKFKGMRDIFKARKSEL